MPRRAVAPGSSWSRFSLKAVVAELVATGMFVYIGTGTATTFSALQYPSGGFTLPNQPRASGNVAEDVVLIENNILTNPSWGVITALAFGLAITVLAFATSHLSGGQLNPAITLGLTLVGALGPIQCVGNIIAQIVGAILGSSFLLATIPNGHDSRLGSNGIAPGVTVGNAFVGEAFMTCVLVATVLETAVNKKSATSRVQAPLAIGFAVFCCHAVLLPLTGTSVNPARSLGPAIVSDTWPGSFWIFIVAPFTGALFAAALHMFFRSDWDFPAEKTPQDVAVGMDQVSSKNLDSAMPSPDKDMPIRHRNDSAGAEGSLPQQQV